MKSASYGWRVLSVAMALCVALAAREAYSMAQTTDAQQPAEPDVAFVTGNDTPTAGGHSGSGQVKSGNLASSSLNGTGSKAAMPAVGAKGASARATFWARLVNAWAAFMYRR